MKRGIFAFHAPYARRFPDPVFKKRLGIDRHILFVPVASVPEGLSLDPNARIPNVRRRVYREVERSLLNDPDAGYAGTFHLKHKGITIVANSVEKVGQNDYEVSIAPGQGILDGGHTYELIRRHIDDGLPRGQFVKFEILTGVPKDWIADIAGGLNTSMQVQPMSLDNLAGRFDPIKKRLRAQPYYAQIAWREGEDGDFDARDIVSLMTCFNIGLFPNDGPVQPVVAYEKKSQALELFEEREDTYDRVLPLLRDILTLYDTIRLESRRHWNEAGGKFGKLAFVEQRKRGQFDFPFIGKQGTYRLMNGALYPMLAAFRWMVDVNARTGKYRWNGGFKRVLKRWEGSAEELMRMTAQASTELGRNPNAIGKSRNHWANLHARVAMRDLMATSRGRP